MTTPPPSAPGKPSATRTQPSRTALRLTLEDEARLLRHHLREGAQWLMRDVRAGVGRLDQAVPLPAPVGSQLPKLQHIVDSAAQATEQVFASAQNAAAVVVSSDAAFRRLRFVPQPLALCLRADGTRNPSRLFTNTFYWLIRKALEDTPASALLLRRRRVDGVWWALQSAELPCMLALRGGAAEGVALDPALNEQLGAAVFEALARAEPVQDAGRMPWAAAELGDAAAASVWESLLAATLAMGLVLPAGAQAAGMDARECLQLAKRLVRAHHGPFLDAMRAAPQDRHAVAREIAFVLRHV